MHGLGLCSFNEMLDAEGLMFNTITDLHHAIGTKINKLNNRRLHYLTWTLNGNPPDLAPTPLSSRDNLARAQRLIRPALRNAIALTEAPQTLRPLRMRTIPDLIQAMNTSITPLDPPLQGQTIDATPNQTTIIDRNHLRSKNPCLHHEDRYAMYTRKLHNIKHTLEDILNEMIRPSDVRHIIGWKQTTTTADPDDESTNYDDTKHTLHYYLIEWEPTFSQKWEIELQQAAGYSYKEKTELTPTDMEAFDTPCEVCQRTDNPEHTLLCDCCDRGFHLHCLNNPLYRVPAGDWHCPTCQEHLQTRQSIDISTTHHVQQTKIFKVIWEPSWHEEQWIHDNDLTDKLQQYQEWASNTRQPQAPHDAHLSNLQRQGIPGNTNSTHAIKQECKGKISFTADPINPDLDIQATSRYEIVLLNAPRVNITKLGTKQLHTVRCYGVYDPRGHVTMMIQQNRLHKLYAMFQETKLEHPSVHQAYGNPPFAEAVYRLLLRYKQGTESMASATASVKMSNHWANPERMMRIKIQYFSIGDDNGGEEFASPLNVSCLLPRYCSAFKEDQLFGATHDAFAHAWTGSNEANPEYEDEAMYKAVRWALFSALYQLDKPVLTILVLPEWTGRSNTSYNRWLTDYPDMVKKVITIPGKWFRFMKPTQFKDEELYAGHPKWSVNLLMVANKAGYDKYCHTKTEREITNFLASTKHALEAITPGIKVPISELAKLFQLTPIVDCPDWKLRRMTNPLLCPPKTLRKIVQTAQPYSPYSLNPDSIRETIIKLQNGTLQVSTLSLAEATPKHNWKTITYTDGSLLKQKKGPAKTGAAVYVPDMEDGLHGTEITIDPCGHGITNTINRCEITAIAVVLQKLPHVEVIATDSAVAMSLIKRITANPMDLNDHIHYDLLISIRDDIKTRSAPLHIMKIKSHTNVTGNEIADYLAKRATRYPTLKFDTGNKPFQNTVWPHASTIDGLEWTIPNLHKDLLKYCHTPHHMGHSNKESIYFLSWKNLQKKPLHTESNRFLTDRTLTYAERKMTLQYRFGCLYTQKLAFRYGFSPTPHCLLCGQLDGGHHSISGCPEMQLPVTARHHKGGSIIAQAVLRGRYGADVVALDLGKLSQYESEHNTPKDTDDTPHKILPTKKREPSLTSTVPKWLLPRILNIRQKQDLKRTTKPDMILAQARKDIMSKRKKYNVTMVEIKYCRDTDPMQQSDKARQQHKQLQRLLVKAGHKVKIVTIMLGVGGTIYQDIKPKLIQLGIDPIAAKTVISKLHKFAATSIKQVMAVRRIKESEVLRQQQPVFINPINIQNRHKHRRGTDNRKSRKRTPPGVT